MIRFEALRVFVTVAECGNIRDAADRLFRTPSAVSMTLRQLEDEIGAPLFESDRKNRLSDLGRDARARAAIVLRDFDEAVAQIRARAEGQAGRLRLASVPSVASHLLPPVLGGFRAERPGVAIDLVDTDSASVQTLVENGEVDLGLAGPSRGAGGALEYRPLFRDPFRLVCPADTDLPDAPLDWSALEPLDLILNGAASVLRAPAYRALADRARLSMRNVTSLLAMVRAGAGVTLLPALATRDLPQGLRALPLADPDALRVVGMLSRAGRVESPLATAFVAHIRSEIAGRMAGLGLLAVD